MVVRCLEAFLDAGFLALDFFVAAFFGTTFLAAAFLATAFFVTAFLAATTFLKRYRWPPRLGGCALLSDGRLGWSCGLNGDGSRRRLRAIGKGFARRDGPGGGPGHCSRGYVLCLDHVDHGLVSQLALGSGDVRLVTIEKTVVLQKSCRIARGSSALRTTSRTPFRRDSLLLSSIDKVPIRHKGILSGIEVPLVLQNDKSASRQMSASAIRRNLRWATG